MKYFHAVKGSMVSLFFFSFIAVAIAYINYDFSGKEEIKLILTISTFLFAILIGFFITRLNSRYNAIRENVAEEDAYWLSFYNMSLIFGKSFQNKIRDLIDKYYILCFDCDDIIDYKNTLKVCQKIYSELINIKNIKADKRQNLYDDMFSILLNIEIRRNKTAIIVLEKLTKGQWTVIITLAILIIFSIFYLSGTSLYYLFASVILSSTLILILLIMRDLQNLRPAGKIIFSESGSEIFDSIGKLRYYNKSHIISGSNLIPDNVIKYRLGLHKRGEKFNIKVINNQKK